MVGVYQIRNVENNKRYIGQSENISHRKACHIYDLKNNRHKNKYLQQEYNENPDDFVFEVLCKCGVDDLEDLERFYIKKYSSNKRETGYNIEGGGVLNKEVAEETKQGISERMTGNQHMIGKRLSDEWKEHLSEAQPHKKKIVCLETGVVYNSFADASRKTGLQRTKIVSACTGKRKSTGGYHFKYVE